MSGFLRAMEEGSRARVAQSVAREPLAALERRARETPEPPRLRNGHAFELIAEVKRRSPVLGRLDGDGPQGALRALAYARGGAAAVSVLTEPSRFDGRLEHLADCAAALVPFGVPAMRKDFIVDAYQLYEARAAGAGGVLLIARLLGDGPLVGLLDCAAALGLFVLLETFDARDIDRAAAALEGRTGDGAMIGVNCRDLDSLVVDPGRLAALAPHLPRAGAHVAESGLSTPADCAAAARAGYRMALVGGALMTAPDPEAVVRQMLAAGRAAA